MKKRVYVFGDSHVSLFMGNDIVLNEYQNGDVWIGGRKDMEYSFLVRRFARDTAYSLIVKPQILEHIRTHIPRGSRLLLSFGEIDCRNHLGKHKNVDVVTTRYIDFIKSITKEYRIALFLPSASGNELVHKQGTIKERNLLTQDFNRKMEAHARVLGIPTLSFLKETLNVDGGTVLEYYFDDVHLSQRITPFLKTKMKNLWKN